MGCTLEIILVLVAYFTFGLYGITFEEKFLAEVPKLGIVVSHHQYLHRSAFDFVYEFERSLDDWMNSSELNGFIEQYPYHPKIVFLPYQYSSITDIVGALCKTVATQDFDILLFVGDDSMDEHEAVYRYFLYFVSYLDIPMFSWHPHWLGMKLRNIAGNIMELDPSLALQSQAMLTMMKWYKWQEFVILTTHTSGHEEFIQATKDNIFKMRNEYRFSLMGTVTMSMFEDRPWFDEVLDMRVPIIWLYSTHTEAYDIMAYIKYSGYSINAHQWIVAQPFVFVLDVVPYPRGTLGLIGNSFDVFENLQFKKLAKAFQTLGKNVHENPGDNSNVCLQSTCNKSEIFKCFYEEHKTRRHRVFSDQEFRDRYISNIWPEDKFYLKLISKEDADSLVYFGEWSPHVGFTQLRNLPPRLVKLYDLRVAFIEEQPLIHKRVLNTSNFEKCTEAEVPCQLSSRIELVSWTGEDHPEVDLVASHCCWGFCVDLLKKLAEDLNIDYKMVRVENDERDAEVNGTSNGLVGALLDGKADMVLGSFTVDSTKARVVDFTMPFLETRTAVVTSKRTRLRTLTPEAFFQYFDSLTWIMIFGLSLHVTASVIILFDWLSPSGYNMNSKHPKGYRFSPLRSYWLVWADILNASVIVIVPKSLPARLMTCAWAMVALVFLAIYQAKCTTVMLTKEEYVRQCNIEETLTSLTPIEPAQCYGTVPNSHTDFLLRKRYPKIHGLISLFNRSSVEDGIVALKNEEMDGFIYNDVVLDYLVSKDPGCTIQTILLKMPITGHSLGFPRKSKFFNMFNDQIMTYKENGYLDRLRHKWMSDKCNSPEEGPRLIPLSLKQYGSAFVLLALGIVLSILVLLVEHVVKIYQRICGRRST